MHVKSESWRKRQGIQIASMLPENPEDALAILDYARQLVTGFLLDEPPPGAKIVAIK